MKTPIITDFSQPGLDRAVFCLEESMAGLDQADFCREMSERRGFTPLAPQGVGLYSPLLPSKADPR